MPIEIASGIVAVETSVADGKIGAICGSSRALAVDAGINDEEGAAIAAAIRELGHEPDRVVYTHAHIDHALGGTVFRDREVYATPGVAAHMRAQLDAWAERREEPRDQLEAVIGWPTVLFSGELELDLGGRSVRVFETPGHAPGAVCVQVPEAGVLFGGDTVVTGIPPTFKDGDSRALEATLRDIAAMEIEVLVPGHGAVVRGRLRAREAVTWAADYLARCRERVEGRIDHTSVDEIVVSAPFEEFIGDRLDADRHRMIWRHEQTIRQLVVELERDAMT